MKQQHADRIGDRMLLAAFVDAGEFVDRQFNRPQDRRKESALAAEHARHVGAKQWRQCDDDQAIEQDLDPAGDGHGCRSFRTARV